MPGWLAGSGVYLKFDKIHTYLETCSAVHGNDDDVQVECARLNSIELNKLSCWACCLFTCYARALARAFVYNLSNIWHARLNA